MATKKQLAALKKGRLARKRKLAAKKRGRKAAPKKRPAKKRTRKTTAKKRRRVARPKKRAVKRTRKPARRKKASKGTEYFVYTKKNGKGKAFYLQKVNGAWNFGAKKPAGMTAAEKTSAEKVAKKLLRKLPAGYHLYTGSKKKS